MTSDLACLIVATAMTFIISLVFLWKLGILKFASSSKRRESEDSKEMKSLLHLNTLESVREFLSSRVQSFQRLTFHGKVLEEPGEIESWQSKTSEPLRHYLQQLTHEGRVYFENALTESTRDLILRMQDATSEPQELSEMLHACLLTLASRVALGKSYDVELLLESRLENFVKLWPDWSVPSYASPQRSSTNDKAEFNAAKETLHNLLKEIISEKRKEWDGCQQDSYVDFYFSENNDKDSNYTALSNHVAGLFFCFRDSLSKALLSSIEFLTSDPEAQEQIREELKAVSVNENLITLWMEQRDRVPRIETFLYEVLRLTTIVPHLMTVSQAATDEAATEAIALNFSSILLDQKCWDYPNEFLPFRFIKSGQLKMQEAFIPFSLGQHSCPGRDLALVSCFVVLSSVLRKFRVTRRADGESAFRIVDLTESKLGPFEE